MRSVAVRSHGREEWAGQSSEEALQEQPPIVRLAGRSLVEEVAGHNRRTAGEVDLAAAVPIDLGREEEQGNDLAEGDTKRTGSAVGAPPSHPAVRHKAAGLGVVRTGSAAHSLAEGEVDIQVGHRTLVEEGSCFLGEELPNLAAGAARYTVLAAVDPILVEEEAVRILLVGRTSESVLSVVEMLGSPR